MAKWSATNGGPLWTSPKANGDLDGGAYAPYLPQQQPERDVMPIAVIGMACRFPGGSTNPEKLWQMLANRRSGWGEVPADRFTQSSFQHPSSSVGGTVSLVLKQIKWILLIVFRSSTRKEHIFWTKTSHSLTPLLSTSAHWKPRSVKPSLMERYLPSANDNVDQAMDPQMRMLLEVAYEALENGRHCTVFFQTNGC